MLVDPDNRHCYLTPRIGISNEDFGFDLIYQAPGPVKPDPYLVWNEPREKNLTPASVEAGRMKRPRPMLNFRGLAALLLLPEDQNRAVLERTLQASAFPFTT